MYKYSKNLARCFIRTRVGGSAHKPSSENGEKETEGESSEEGPQKKIPAPEDRKFKKKFYLSFFSRARKDVYNWFRNSLYSRRRFNTTTYVPENAILGQQFGNRSRVF